MKFQEVMTMNKVKHAIILSAGFGTRLKPLTDSTPKALIKVGGVPMLQRIYDVLKIFNFEKIFVNTHYHAEQISQYISNNQLSANTLYEPEILETGGTFRSIANNNPEIDSLLAISCDCLFLNLSKVLTGLIENWNQSKMDGLFTLVPSLKNGTSPDFEISSENKLIYPVNNKSAAYTFTSPYIIKPKILLQTQQIKLSIVKDFIYPNFNQLPNLYGYSTEENWIDIGTPKDLERANNLFS